MTQATGVFLLFLTVLNGCATSSHNSAGSNMSDFKNPDPEIESLHVRAYNIDLGIGGTQDRAKANELYLQAALAGDPRSMMNLGINLIGGDGIEKNEIEGFAWIDAARFLTQHTSDMTTKWRIREVIGHYETELSKTIIDKAKSRAKELLEQVEA